MRVLAIDPGSTAGFCFLDDSRKATIWSVVLPKGKKKRADRWNELRRHVDSALSRHLPEVVAVELPLSRGQDAKQCLFGDVAIVQQLCWELGVTCLDPINVSTVKQHAGVPRNEHGNKDVVIRSARLMGFVVGNDHEADASVLADLVQGRAVREALVEKATKKKAA